MRIGAGDQLRLRYGLKWSKRTPPLKPALRLTVLLASLTVGYVIITNLKSEYNAVIAYKDAKVAWLNEKLDTSHHNTANRLIRLNKMASHVSNRFRVDRDTATDIVTYADNLTKDNRNVTLPVIMAVIATESGFDQHAVSPGNAKGLMQLTKSSGRGTSTNIYENIRNGVRHLEDYYVQLGSLDAALQAYNVGVGAYKYGTRAPEYLGKVKRHLREFEQVWVEKS